MGRLRDRLAAQELGVLGLVLVAAVIMLAFFHLADEVVEGDTHAFDSAVLLSLRNHADLADPVGPAWLEWAARYYLKSRRLSSGHLDDAVCHRLPAHYRQATRRTASPRLYRRRDAAEFRAEESV